MLVLLDRKQFDGLFDLDPARLDLPFALEFRLIDPGRCIGLDDGDLLPRFDLELLNLRSFSMRWNSTS